MAVATAEYGLVITGEDRSSRATQSAERGVQRLRERFSGLSQSVTAMPGQFGAASAALLLFQGGLGQTSGAVADVANKVAAVAGMLAVGGPLGIALAVVTGLVAALSAVWESYSEDLTQAREENEKMRQSLNTLGGAIDAGAEKLTEMRIELRNFGDEAAIAAEKNARVMGSLQFQLANASRELQQLTDKAKAYTVTGVALNEEEQKRVQILNETIDGLRVRISQEKEIVKVSGQLETAERKHAQAIEWKRQKDLEAQQAEAFRAAENKRMKAEELAHERNRAATILELERKIAQGRAEIDQANFARRVEITNEEIELTKAAAQSQVDAIGTITDASLNALGDVLTGQASAAEIMANFSKSVTSTIKSMIVEIVKEKIKAALIDRAIDAAKVKQNASVAATEAAKPYAGIPVVGIALAAAAAAAMFAMMMGLKKFRHGGMVGGSPTGFDSQFAAVEPGEVIIPAPVVRNLMTGNRGDAIGGMQRQVVNQTVVNVSSIVPHSTRELRRTISTIEREQETNRRLGVRTV